MSSAPPFLYDAEPRQSWPFPTSTFDPKAVTRASREVKPQKPPQNGPLLSFNRHPDAHMVLSYRSTNLPSINPRMKTWIRSSRRFQLFLRFLESSGAAGLVILMSLMTKVDLITAWVLRIAPGVVVLNCIYAIYHLARNAADRPPASSASYQLYAAVTDLLTAGLYGFGAFAAKQKSSNWTTSLANHGLTDYFIDAIFYTFTVAGGLHLISMSLSVWLCSAFRKISMMPPDMNPLEDHLTARPQHHKKSKSSVTTMGTFESDSRLSTRLESHRRSGLPYEDVSRPPQIPFMHTRTSSRDSTSTRNSQINFPSRQYQIMPVNASRTSLASMDSKNALTTRQFQRGSYVEIPLEEPGSSISENSPHALLPSPSREAKFTETWMPTNSLISRTNQRNREIVAAKAVQPTKSKAYSALSQQYNVDDSSGSEYGDENDTPGGLHPNPLGSHPPMLKPPRASTPYNPWNGSLSEPNNNTRRVSDSQDIVDEKLYPMGTELTSQRNSPHPSPSFYARPYGDLKSATPPVIVGNSRKVSSGNDYSTKKHVLHERRNVSGKIAEEGRAGTRNSQQRIFFGNVPDNIRDY